MRADKTQDVDLMLRVERARTREEPRRGVRRILTRAGWLGFVRRHRGTGGLVCLLLWAAAHIADLLMTHIGG